MGFLDNFKFNRDTKVESVSINTNENNGDWVNNVMNFAMETSLPIIKEASSYDWVKYQSDLGDEYPAYLENLYNTSPTHQAIVNTKALVVAGDGFEVDETNLTEMEKLDLYKLMEYTDGRRDIEDFITDLSKDNELYGSVAIEVIWSLDFTKIVRLNRISPKHIRCGKYDDGDIKCYYYSRDWSNRREEITKMHSFDANNTEHHRQLLYVGTHMVANEYYYEPSYLASTNWIELEANTGLFYRSLMENGFNPSVIVKFFRKPSSLEERDEVVRGLKRSFGGVKNSGKAVVLFSDGKELAPEIEPIQTQNLDAQYTVLADQIQSKILTGARVVTPELFGIAVAGKLGTADFETQVEAFTKFVIRPQQQFLNRVINKLLKVNGLDVNFKILPLELGRNNKTEN